MAKIKMSVFDPDEPSRKSILWLDCNFDGGTWSQEAFPGKPMMVFPASRGEWKKEEIQNGKAGKWGDKIVLYCNGNRIATFIFQELKFGDNITGKYVSRDEFPTSQGDLFWKGSFKARIEFAPPAIKTFSISAAGGMGMGYGVIGKDYLRFEIKDLTDGSSAFYFYDGIGLSVGIKKLPSVPGGLGGSTKGPANNFTTHGWRTVRDFEGGASSGGVSVNLSTSWGFNWFTFSDIKVVPFNGGDGYSMPSVGHTQGSFRLIP